MKSILPMTLLAACAWPAPRAGSPAGAVPAELVGYLIYSGEYQIYPNEKAMHRRLGGKRRRCVSALHSQLSEIELAGRRFNRTKVRLVGRYQDWKPLWDEWIRTDPLTEGTPILQNTCNRSRVFIADAIYPADAQPDSQVR